MSDREKIRRKLVELKAEGVQELRVLEYLLKKLLQYEDNVHIVVKPEFRFHDGHLKKVTIYPTDEVKSIDLAALR